MKCSSCLVVEAFDELKAENPAAHKRFTSYEPSEVSLAFLPATADLYGNTIQTTWLSSKTCC
eukprot:2183134-Pleurochrysis_carterae.AAC.1